MEASNVLITGASSGIGRATAIEFGNRGCNIAISARRTEHLQDLAKNIEQSNDARVVPITTDVSDSDQVSNMYRKAVDELGYLDVVVANAGVDRPVSMETVSDERFDSINKVNVYGSFYTAREAIPHLRKTDGDIVFVGSFAGQYPRTYNPVYAASKWWLRGFALSLAGVVGEDGIGVCLVNPSEVRTEIGKAYGEPLRDRYEEGQVTEPEDIAQAIIFATTRNSPNYISEIDMFRKDKFSDF